MSSLTPVACPSIPKELPFWNGTVLNVAHGMITIPTECTSAPQASGHARCAFGYGKYQVASASSVK
jgi:hypothetical protein